MIEINELFLLALFRVGISLHHWSHSYAIRCQLSERPGKDLSENKRQQRVQHENGGRSFSFTRQDARQIRLDYAIVIGWLKDILLASINPHVSLSTRPWGNFESGKEWQKSRRRRIQRLCSKRKIWHEFMRKIPPLSLGIIRHWWRKPAETFESQHSSAGIL